MRLPPLPRERRLRDDINAPTPLDTLTTRFLMLFVIVLAIPLLSIIIFTVNLLSSQVDQTTLREALRNDGALQRAFQTAFQKSESSQPEASAEESSRANRRTIIIDLAKRRASGLTPTPMPLDAAIQELPGLTLTQDPSQRGDAVTFSGVWDNHLTLFRFSPCQTPCLQRVGLAEPVTEAFLADLYRADPLLGGGVWILQEPFDADEPQWLSRSDAQTTLLSRSEQHSLLRALPEEPTPHAPLIMAGEQKVRVVQRFAFDASNQKIARIIAFLPTRAFENAMGSYYLGMYLIVVSGLLFSITVAILAARRITLPVLSLVRQVTTLNRASDLDRRIEVRGVHEINTLAKAFNRLLERLRDEHRMKDEFVATLTHDLKVPLLAEKQTLHYLQQGAYGDLSAEQAEALTTLASASDANLQLVNSILNVYRYESSQARLRFETVDLPALAQEAVAELASLAQSRQLDLRIVREAGDLNVWADRHELRRALTNLIGNAIANTPRHGWIEFEIIDAESFGELIGPDPRYRDATLTNALTTHGCVLARVRDCGVGFPVEDLPRLFTPFIANRGRTPISMGLGLYNCHQVVTAHGGALWVETTEGEGSSVNLLLPRRTPENDAPPPTEETAS
ncbi:MAG: HAMP domain-containing histidine kinase [Vampirovibrionales bacterium]|nr:HAMP domain-containing histidine kinase [Vampirovibrionales bacterium]